MNNLDEWFGTDDTDYNVTLQNGVLTVTKYKVQDGHTITLDTETVLQVHLPNIDNSLPIDDKDPPQWERDI